MVNVRATIAAVSVALVACTTARADAPVLETTNAAASNHAPSDLKITADSEPAFTTASAPAFTTAATTGSGAASEPVAAASDPVAADPAAAVVARPAPHANPRLKASYRVFAISGLDGSALWLQGAQLDAYAISRRWVRVGFELEGGGGGATLVGTPATLSYGLAGISGGVQYPARVTPFLEGRFVAGVMTGQLDGTLTIGAASFKGTSATTWIYGGGLEGGAEFYVFRRMYLSAALGWMRSTWHGIDVAATTETAKMTYKDLTGDTVTFKIGLGI